MKASCQTFHQRANLSLPGRGEKSHICRSEHFSACTYIIREPYIGIWAVAHVQESLLWIWAKVCLLVLYNNLNNLLKGQYSTFCNNLIPFLGWMSNPMFPPPFNSCSQLFTRLWRGGHYPSGSKCWPSFFFLSLFSLSLSPLPHLP